MFRDSDVNRNSGRNFWTENVEGRWIGPIELVFICDIIAFINRVCRAASIINYTGLKGVRLDYKTRPINPRFVDVTKSK